MQREGLRFQASCGGAWSLEAHSPYAPYLPPSPTCRAILCRIPLPQRKKECDWASWGAIARHPWHHKPWEKDRAMGPLSARRWLMLAKDFCRAKSWAKFPFWRGAVRGEVFREVCREVFHEVFGLVLLGHSEQKTSALNSHDPAQQNWRNFREKLHDEVLQGDPRQD